MSFAYDVKRELTEKSIDDRQILLSELYAMLLFSKTFSDTKIIFKTENEYTANRFCDLLTLLFSPIIERRFPTESKANEEKSKKSRKHTVILINPEDCKKIFDYYGHDNRDISLRVNRANLGDEKETRAFIKGAFLSCGSVTDPLRCYHLEFCVPYKNLCCDLCKILSEQTELDISVKMLMRNGSYIAYIKDSEQITDLLTYMGATNCAMNIMGTKALKQIRNNVNRKANSEIANLQKLASASAIQIKAINRLKKSGKFNLLTDEQKEIANLRLEFPELSLRDLGERLTPQLSRSGVNHRLEKIIKLSMED